MFRKLSAATLVALLSLGGTAIAQDESPKSDTPTFGKWYCVKASKDALSDVSFESKGVRVNNILLRKDKSMLTDAPTLELEASSSNRSERNVSVSIEVTGLKGDFPTFAISARSVFSFIGPNKNEDLKNYIFTPFKTLDQTDTLCVRVTGFASTK